MDGGWGRHCQPGLKSLDFVPSVKSLENNAMNRYIF